MKSLVEELVCRTSCIETDFQNNEIRFHLERHHRPNGPGVIRIARELMPDAQAAVVVMYDDCRTGTDSPVYVYPLKDYQGLSGNGLWEGRVNGGWKMGNCFEDYWEMINVYA